MDTNKQKKKRKNGSKKSKRQAKGEASDGGDDLTGSIFVERNYSRGVNTCFSDKFPEALARRGVTEQEFQSMIARLNRYFDEAEEVNCTTVTEGCFGFLTFYLLLLCYQPRSHRLLHDMQAWLQQENKQVWAPKGLEVIDPLTNGLIFLEIKVHPLK